MYTNEDKNNVGVGWHPIIDKLDAALRLIDPDYEVAQIKEKFGGLRYYIQPSEACRALPDAEVRVWAMTALESQAEHESLYTCEECGQRGTKCSIGYWMRTLCHTHTAQAWAAWAEKQKDLVSG